MQPEYDFSNGVRGKYATRYAQAHKDAGPVKATSLNPSTVTYWLDLFTGTSWQEFLDAGATISGFRESRWASVQKIKAGDVLLCYLTGVSRFIGALEVNSAPFKDQKVIWKDDVFPCRVSVKPIVTLKPETGVPVYSLQARLSCFTEASSPVAWTGSFRGSPSKWKSADGETVLEALHEASRNPVTLPTDPAKLARRPRAFSAKGDQIVTVPEREETVIPSESKSQKLPEETEHTEVQYLLLRMGSEMGYDVWVARNDRSREYKGKKFAQIPRLKSELPSQFDEATNKTIELIDVLWLKGNSYVAAFEIESTTSIYSGLLRMSDLTAMQPNLNIPLYLVAPDERRNKVFTEVNRPTFSKLSPQLADICRFISFGSLRDKTKEIGPYLRFLKPEFVEELSESCLLEGS